MNFKLNRMPGPQSLPVVVSGHEYAYAKRADLSFGQKSRANPPDSSERLTGHNGAIFGLKEPVSLPDSVLPRF